MQNRPPWSAAPSRESSTSNKFGSAKDTFFSRNRLPQHSLQHIKFSAPQFVALSSSSSNRPLPDPAPAEATSHDTPTLSGAHPLARLLLGLSFCVHFGGGGSPCRSLVSGRMSKHHKAPRLKLSEALLPKIVYLCRRRNKNHPTTHPLIPKQWHGFT